jgi:spoIIIJ-associated protein
MRNFSNQNTGKTGYGRPSGNSGGYNRENRGGGYRGGNRPDRNESRSEYRGDRKPNSSNYRPSSSRSSYAPNRQERFDRPNRGEGHSSPRIGGSWVEVTGRTIAEAIEEAARRFNVSQTDLKTDVVDEGAKGFLGIGSKPAKVKISLKPAAVPPFAEGVLSRILRGMSLPDKVKIQKDSDGNTVLNILGPSSGTLIGRHGHTLEALQYLVAKVVQRMTGDEKTIVVVDVESYLERQTDKLKELAVNLAQKARETGTEIPMRPMSSKDRRVVHLTLKENEHVTTESRGEGLRRKVVIVPKVKAPPPVVSTAAPVLETPVGDVVPAPAADLPKTDATAEAWATPEPGNTVPLQNKPAEAGNTETMAAPQPEPGNAIPPMKEVDDSIGNRV